MSQKAKNNWEKFKKMLAPEEEVGAIEINNRVIKGFCFSNDGNYSIKWSAIVPTPANTINNGFVQNEELLIKALIGLKKEINKKKKGAPYVILSLPPQNFFTSILTVPKLAKKESMTEAVRLNLRLRSPIRIDNAYIDWEIIDDSSFQNNYTIFAAVGDKNGINKYIECLAKAGFKTIAVEKPALGLLRFIEKFSANQSSYLLINIDRDGVDLVVSKDNRLVFYDFDSLSEIARYDLDNNLSPKDFHIYLAKKVGQVANFCQSRQNQSLKSFFLFSIIPELKNELVSLVSANFNLEILTLQNHKLVKVAEEWYSIIGTALRGTIPRSQDSLVSLMETGTEEDYKQNQVIKFISMWGKISITVMVSLAIIFFSLSTVFFSEEEARLIQKSNLVTSNNTFLIDRTKVLEAKADEFNKEIGSISTVVSKITDWDSQIKFCFELAEKNKINILKVFVSNESRNVTLQGVSSTQNAIANFRSDLAGTNRFTNVTAPLESISTDGQNHYFSIKFNLGS